MVTEIQTDKAADAYYGWRKLVVQYQQPDLHAGVWQVINSFGGFFVSLLLMVLSLQVGYWLTLVLALPTAGFLVRIFIIQHDCGHGSFLSHDAPTTSQARWQVFLHCFPTSSGANLMLSITLIMLNLRSAGLVMFGR